MNQEPLEKLKQIFGGKIYKLKRGTNCQQAYAWRLYGRKAIGLMMTVWTLMSQRRRDQIELAIERWKYNQGQDSERYKLSRPRGENNFQAKLTDDIVMAIRESSEPSRILAKTYGVSHASILNVRKRKTWSHVFYNRAIA